MQTLQVSLQWPPIYRCLRDVTLPTIQHLLALFFASALLCTWVIHLLICDIFLLELLRVLYAVKPCYLASC